MPMIDIPAADDVLLEQIVPNYLRGQNRMTQRVRWAIDDALKRHGIEPGNGKNPAPENEPEAAG